MLATVHRTPMWWRRPRRGCRHDRARCAVRQGVHGQGGRTAGANAVKRGLPLLTAAYKPATPQRLPLCTFGPSGPLKHHGFIP